ncbi:MAG TPA: hypothetical protein VGN54_14855 [Mycobacteriales bacterium]|nr:hypothetical protein [Mycobacteriales bacterium]
MVYLLIAVVVLVALALLAFAFGRRTDVLSDIERFHRARQMTTAWSHDSQGRPGVMVAPIEQVRGTAPAPPAQTEAAHEVPGQLQAHQGEPKQQS